MLIFLIVIQAAALSSAWEGFMNRTDWLLASLCAAWLGALLVITTDAQDHWRALLASDVTAAWAGAVATFAAVWSGFRLARIQQHNQAQERRKEERAAIAAKLRAATMLIKSAHSAVTGLNRHIETSTHPRVLAAVAAEKGFTSLSISGLASIDISTIPVPAAIDTVMASRGELALYTSSIQMYGSGEVDGDHFLTEGRKRAQLLWSMFLTMAHMAKQYEPDWESPEVWYPDQAALEAAGKVVAESESPAP
jgi:hypothetical protein